MRSDTIKIGDYMSRREKRAFTENFKIKMVTLYNNGKSRNELIKEYDLTPSALGKWIAYYNNSGSFKAIDNLTDEQKRILELEKVIKQKDMEIDILKQAALIIGRK